MKEYIAETGGSLLGVYELLRSTQRIIAKGNTPCLTAMDNGQLMLN